MAQLPNESSFEEIRERVRLGCEVNAGTNTGYCFFEGRAGHPRRHPRWSAAEVIEAADVAREVMAEFMLPERSGSCAG